MGALVMLHPARERCRPDSPVPCRPMATTQSFEFGQDLIYVLVESEDWPGLPRLTEAVWST